MDAAFQAMEATIDGIHEAYRTGALTARQLVQTYLDRIEAYDKSGPRLNSVISLNEDCLADADRLDAACKLSGLVGPLHGIPILIKDQVDVVGMRTTLGSRMFEDYRPRSEGFVIRKLRSAGAILLGKTALGELGGGDTHGSLFGSTRNVYDLERTAGGSSGGSGVSVSANFCTLALGQEGFSSIRRPSIWNGIVGMRPSIGLVSRSGVFGGWPTMNGSLGPMARTVQDLARFLDVMVGYDPEDPATAYGYGRTEGSYADLLSPQALKGARLGILREPMGYDTEPHSEDFQAVDEVFDRAVGELREAGAEIVDPIVIADLKPLLARRARDAAADDEMFRTYFSRGDSAYRTRRDVIDSPMFKNVVPGSQHRIAHDNTPEQHYDYLTSRERLMNNMLTVMADQGLDAIVHKAVEHQPTFIRDGVNPPFVDQKGAPHLNTYLMSVPSIVVPAGFTRMNLPAGITFLGRPYDDARMIRYAYAYEQAAHHRRVPSFEP